MKMVFVMGPIFVSKLLNNSKIGIGWRNKAGIPKFVILWLRYGNGLEMRPIYVRKLLNNTKICVGWSKAGIPKFVI